MLPHSLIGRILLALWLTACAAALVFAYMQRVIHDTDVAFVYIMLFLTFPLGYAFAAFAGVVFHVLYSMFGVVVPGGFVPNLVSWLFFVAVGFFQWFVAIPWLYKKLRRSSNSAVKRDAPQAARPLP